MPWDCTLQCAGFRTTPTLTDVFRNPSARELRVALDNSGRMARGVVTAAGDVLVWNSDHATHGDILDHATPPSGCDRLSVGWFCLYADRLLIHDTGLLRNEDDHPGDHRPYRIAMANWVVSLRQNGHLRRLYRGVPDIFISDTSGEHILSDLGFEGDVLVTDAVLERCVAGYDLGCAGMMIDPDIPSLPSP